MKQAPQSSMRTGFALLFGLALFFQAILCPANLSADEILDRSNGEQSAQDSYGGRGYAVRYSVPGSAPTWWVVAVNIHGESYGTPNAGNEFFTISFMDMEGRVYARSEHPKTLFSAKPEWKTVRITPTQVPREFWVIVDFKSSQNDGIFIGVVNNGGGHSMLTDPDCRLYPITEEDNSVRPVDWCISLRVRSKYKGKMVRYDPDAEPLNKIAPDPDEVVEQKQTTDHFTFNYTKLEDIWGVAVLRLLEAARECLVEGYGLILPERITIQAGMDGAHPTEVRVAGEDAMVWNVSSRSELLPLRRGGTYTHVYGFCLELARMALRYTFPDSRLMPEGMEEGLASYLAGEAVRHANDLHGQKLWPIHFTYVREEGPYLVKRWALGEDPENPPEEPAQRHAALLLALDQTVQREALAEMLGGLFADPVAAREFYGRLEEETAALEAVQIPEGLFPAEFVDPPFLWLCPEPDLASMETFGGLGAKRFKDQIILSYDDGKGGDPAPFDDGTTVMFTTPPGSWRIESIRLFGRRIGGGEGSARLMSLSLQGKDFNELGILDVAPDSIRTKKPAWNKLGGFPDAVLSGPFLIRFRIDPDCPDTVEVCYDDAGGGGHGFRLVPGSHAEPLQGGADPMIRIFISSVSGKDKSEVDAILKQFRKELSQK